MTPFNVIPGDSPVILAMPHGGTWLPDDVANGLNDVGLARADTDWHIAALYEGLLPGATTVSANVHRYVIDANRDPEDVSLYPGQNTTSLCPLTDFDGRLLHRDGHAPDAMEQRRRIAAFHQPYHQALSQQVRRVRALHGVAVVYDCHSIRSRIPFLFEGELPALNIGTNGGLTCDARIEAKAVEIARSSGLSCVLNGRFKGGWTTRHYGQPSTGVHAIQMEIAQSAYLEREQAPWAFSESKSRTLRPVLRGLLEAIQQVAHDISEDRKP